MNKTAIVRAVLPLVCTVLVTGGAVVRADEGGKHRHALLVRPDIRRPAGVPSDYVATPNGFFHPSCVTTLLDSEFMGPDLVIRGLDGLEHGRVETCRYPRYDSKGGVIVAGAAGAPALRDDRLPSQGVAGGVLRPFGWDGWIESYYYAGGIASGSSLSTQWLVPLPPANTSGQILYFFNDIEPGDVFQPVLDYNGWNAGQWSITSYECCYGTNGGNTLTSTSLVVAPGDLIEGQIIPGSCDATTENWTVITSDLTSGMSTTLHATVTNQLYDCEAGNDDVEVNPGVLETYSLTSCDMFPANGEITFFDNDFTDGTGAPETESYTLTLPATSGTPSGFPTNCGYAGSSAGNSYTLVFGTSPTAVDGGLLDASALDDASLADDSSVGEASVGDDGGSPGDAFAADAFVVNEAGFPEGDASLQGEGDDASLVDSGVLSQTSGGTGSQNGASPEASGSGCACTLATQKEAHGSCAWAVGMLAFASWMKRRRRRTRESEPLHQRPRK